MPAMFEMQEVGGIARTLFTNADQADDAAHQVGIKVGAEVKRRAQAAAPSDRPWLSKSGIRVKSWKQKGNSHTDVYTTADDEGRPVGFFVEYGTTGTPPVPFLSSQMAWAADAYADGIAAALDPLA